MNATERLNEITERTRAATDGPWEACKLGPYWFVEQPAEFDLHRFDTVAIEICRDIDQADAEFIAACRDDVPAMASTLRKLIELCDTADDAAALADVRRIIEDGLGAL